MRLSLSGRDVARIARLLMLIAGSMAALAPMLHVQSAVAQDVRAAIQKANLYIEVAKLTERAVDSWDRYASWVNMKTGPTGKERYISYGMYELYDVTGLLKEARKAANLKPSTPKLDTMMKRYMDAYEVLVPVMNRANDYYERKRYQTDGMAEGRALHAQMVPLANAFLIEREATLRELRAFVRDVEQQEVAAIEAREGRSRKWQVAQVMHAANRVVDHFPRTRPTPIDSDTIEEMLKAIGPDTPGEKLDEIIAGVVRPAGVVIDIKQLEAAVKRYAEAVEMFDRFAAEKPEDLKDLKGQARRLLDGLRGLQEPLTRSQGRDFDGSGPLVSRVAQVYFSMLSASRSVSPGALRFLP